MSYCDLALRTINVNNKQPSEQEGQKGSLIPMGDKLRLGRILDIWPVRVFGQFTTGNLTSCSVISLKVK